MFLYFNGLSLGTLLAFDRAVPESASWAMLIAGFGLIGATIARSAHERAPFRLVSDDTGPSAFHATNTCLVRHKAIWLRATERS
jgi:hypothetical protein